MPVDRRESRAVRWGLLACVTVELVAVGVWVGGLGVLVGAVIPAVFNTLGGQDAGGILLTRAFEGYNRLVLGAMTILILGGLWRGWLAARGGRPVWRVTRAEGVLLAAMVVIALGIIFVAHPQAAARQAEAFALKDAAARKAALELFFRVHQPIRVLYMINLVLGVALLGAKVRSWLNHGEAAI